MSVTISNTTREEQEREARFVECLTTATPPLLANAVLATWKRLDSKVVGALRVPYFDLIENGGALLTWDAGTHHLDVEVFPNMALDFFYLNRSTNEAWDVVVLRDELLPDLVRDSLNYFSVPT